MRKLAPVLSLIVLSLVLLCLQVPAWAQLEAPNEAGVAFSHWHTTVLDVEATKKFWTILGGKPIKIDGTDVMKFPGFFIFLTKGSPSGGSYGSVINHLTFLVPNHKEAIPAWKAAGATAIFGLTAYGRTSQGYVFTPDDLKLRITDDKSLTVANAVAKPGIQVWAPKDSIPDLSAWYVKTFGAKPGQAIRDGVAINGIPGLRVAVTAAGAAPEARIPNGVGLIHGAPPDQAFMDKLLQTNLSLPIKRRTLDHIGFEVTNLEAFCKRLEAGGVKFNQPYSKKRHKSFASAELTDAWGISIELTEGLRKF